MLFNVARKSLLNRKTTALLTVLSIAVSVFVLLGVEHIRREAKTSFTRTLSDTDLIVGARTGEINLLLYSIFRIGNATNNISWDSYQRLSQVKGVKWHIPFSLGDSHKGYRVLGTTDAYFKHYKYGNKQALALAEGQAFEGVFDVVLGAEVAKKLNYGLGDRLILAHGVSTTSFSLHDDKPFTVVGILKPTGTPVDQTLHVSLAAIKAIHLNWKNGVRLPSSSHSISADQMTQQDLITHDITAFLVGLTSKSYTFSFQRLINNYPNESLMAVLPGATLSRLWQTISTVETVLLIISGLVLFSSLMGMITMLLSSLRERNRELAILRAIGANPLFNFILIEGEVLLLTLAGIALAMLGLLTVLFLGGGYLRSEYGLIVSAQFITPYTAFVLIVIVLSALAIGLLPGWFAYRRALQQGLTVSQ